MEEPDATRSGTTPATSGEAPPEARAPRVRLVVGLGNPGPRYADTRHNAGFLLADRLAARCGARFDIRGSHFVAARGRVGDTDLWIAKPSCYMNRSGLAVLELIDECGVQVTGILVAYDDFHLPFGALRFRRKGSAGGQNGVQNILDLLGREEFRRLRIGIGSPAPGEDPADHVLAPIPPSERRVLDATLEAGAEGAELFARTGDIDTCMNRYNGWEPGGPDASERHA